jgi:hypothetical protein
MGCAEKCEIVGHVTRRFGENGQLDTVFLGIGNGQGAIIGHKPVNGGIDCKVQLRGHVILS